MIIVVIVILIAGIGFIVYRFQTLSPEVKEGTGLENRKEVNALVFYHWWQSTGELAAINSLIDVFVKKYPDTAIMASYVLGGGGMEMIAKIKPMILVGEAPDSFVAHPGYEIYPYVKEGLLESLDYIWESEKLADIIPMAVQEASKIDDHYYVIPLDIHRNNLIWYNKALLDKYQIDPNSLTDWDSLFKACEKLRKEGIKYPIQMGRAWTASFVFNNILLGRGGVKYYEDYINGRITSADDPKLMEVLGIFKKYLDYVNPDSAAVEWNDAINRIIKGESAFNIMGDWANGEFRLVGMKYNEDYGTISVPETDGLHMLVVDGFVEPKGVSHPTSADNWLKVVGSRLGQDAFNSKKGSITPRKDVDISLYDNYQKSAISYFQKARLVIDTGSALPYEFRDKLNDIMANFVRDKDTNKTAEALTDYTKETQNDFRMMWSIK